MLLSIVKLNGKIFDLCPKNIKRNKERLIKEIRMDLLNGVNLYSMQSMQIKQKLKESLTAEEKTEVKTETQTSKYLWLY